MRKALMILTGAVLVGLGTNPTIVEGQPVIRNQAPTDRAADLLQQTLNFEFDWMEAEDISTVRLLEGGTHNVNIRHEENVRPETHRVLVHPDFVDVWVVRRGSAVITTGGRMEGDRQVGGTERLVTEGDVVFIPNGTPHGIKESQSITWLNIRYVFEKQ